MNLIGGNQIRHCTLVMGPECTWCSCHSPGTVSGNFIARRVPELVPAKSIRPERDITHCVKTISLAGTSRRICWKQMRFVLRCSKRINLFIFISFLKVSSSFHKRKWVKPHSYNLKFNYQPDINGCNGCFMKQKTVFFSTVAKWQIINRLWFTKVARKSLVTGFGLAI